MVQCDVVRLTVRIVVVHVHLRCARDEMLQSANSDRLLTKLAVPDITDLAPVANEMVDLSSCGKAAMKPLIAASRSFPVPSSSGERASAEYPGSLCRSDA